MKTRITLILALLLLSVSSYAQIVGDTSGNYFFEVLENPIHLDDYNVNGSTVIHEFEYDIDQDNQADFGIKFLNGDKGFQGYEHSIEIYALDSSTTQISYQDTLICYHDGTPPTPLNEIIRAKNSSYLSEYATHQKWTDGAIVYQKEFRVSTQYPSGYHCDSRNAGDQYYIIKKEANNETVFAWILVQNEKSVSAYGSSQTIDEEENTATFNYDKSAVAFPNPASDKIIIQETSDLPNIDKVEVFAVTGDKMLQFSTVDEYLRIDVNDWPNGLYIIKCYDESGGIYTQKIVVENP